MNLLSLPVNIQGVNIEADIVMSIIWFGGVTLVRLLKRVKKFTTRAEISVTTILGIWLKKLARVTEQFTLKISRNL